MSVVRFVTVVVSISVWLEKGSSVGASASVSAGRTCAGFLVVQCWEDILHREIERMYGDVTAAGRHPTRSRSRSKETVSERCATRIVRL